MEVYCICIAQYIFNKNDDKKKVVVLKETLIFDQKKQ